MNPSKSFLLRILSSFVLLYGMFNNSCKKDTLIENPPGTSGGYSSLQNFFVQNGALMQTFTINPQTTNTITGNQGTSFIVYANTLVDSVNQPPSGNVTAQLIEIYNVKDMVLSNKPTTSYGQILQSGGEIFIKFVANGISYYPIQGISLQMPNSGIGPLIQNAQLFWGMNDTTPSGVSWFADSSIIASTDSSGNYLFSLPNLYFNWLNCDAFYNANPLTNVDVTPQVSGGNGETVDVYVFLVFKNINSMMGIYTSISNIFTAYNIPVGMQTSVVAIGVGRVTKESYFGKTSITVSQSQTVSLNMVPTTADQIIIELQNL